MLRHETLKEADVQPLLPSLLALRATQDQLGARNRENERTVTTAGSCMWSPMNVTCAAPFIKGMSETGCRDVNSASDSR